MEYKFHLRLAVCLIIILPILALLINAIFMHRYLIVENTTRETLNHKLEARMLNYRWLKATEAERERLKQMPALIKPTEESSEISVTFFAKFAYKRMKIIRNMIRCLGSLLDHTTAPMHFHILLDTPSQLRINRTLTKIALDHKKKFKVSYHESSSVFLQFRKHISTIKRYFFTRDVGRYSDDLFFVSQIFHLAEPFLNLDKLLMIDLDTKFRVDVRDLIAEFNNFRPSEVMAIAYDQQPEYRFDFSAYRAKHPGTDVGSPHPEKQGFNTGVVLFDLKKMRKSKLYNELLKEHSMRELCLKYSFRGYMGHQDFFTLTGMEHPQLYHVLDCLWNRQLDTGWEKTAGKELFQKYHDCPGEVKIYHGNGETFIPWN